MGQNIKLLRKKRKLTQEQLAEQVDIDQKQISKIESGRVQARFSTYLRIANVLDVSIDRFLIDAFMTVPPQHQLPGLSGEAEQRLLQDLVRALLRYLEEKET